MCCRSQPVLNVEITVAVDDTQANKAVGAHLHSSSHHHASSVSWSWTSNRKTREPWVSTTFPAPHPKADLEGGRREKLPKKSSCRYPTLAGGHEWDNLGWNKIQLIETHWKIFLYDKLKILIIKKKSIFYISTIRKNEIDLSVFTSPSQRNDVEHPISFFTCYVTWSWRIKTQNHKIQAPRISTTLLAHTFPRAKNRYNKEHWSRTHTHLHFRVA